MSKNFCQMAIWVVAGAGLFGFGGNVWSATPRDLDQPGTPVVFQTKPNKPDRLSSSDSRSESVTHSRVDDAQLLEAVAPFPTSILKSQNHDTKNQKLLQQYYDAVFDWAQVGSSRFRSVPSHPDWGYFGDTDHCEDTIRPLCYTAMVDAFISQVTPPQNAEPSQATSKVSPPFRKKLEDEAVAILRYLTHAHCSGGGTCLNGKPWGNQWQSAMWTRSLAVGGWLLWEKLDRPMKLAVARTVEFEADRFIAKQPKSSLFNDTGAEENAWNSGLLAMAVVMMPDHPRAKLWDEAAKRYMYNTFSVKADKKNHTIGDDGRAVRDWVTTVNAHEDYTVENHRLVHVGYLKNSHAMLLEALSAYALTDAAIPQAGFHHARDVFEILLKCMSDDGAPVYFGGNDWKLVHTQGSDVINYCMMNLLLDDPRGAYLEPIALDWVRRIQKAQDGHFNVRRDLEYGGFAASRLINCYLAHAKRGPGCEPTDKEKFFEDASGTLLLKHGDAVLHRTPTKFASFAWGRARLGLALGKSGTWTNWPHYSSYLGHINSMGTRDKKCRVKSTDYDIQPNSFRVIGSLERGGTLSKGGVVQDFAFLSPPGDLVVYIERLRYKPGKLVDRHTGIVGIEYPLGGNEILVYGPFGKKTLVGIEKKAEHQNWPANWLNIGNQTGYVICRSTGEKNQMFYHDMTKGTGRVPKLQEWISLIGDEPSTTASDEGKTTKELESWACVVTFLNQNASETRTKAAQVTFDHDGNTATCRIGDQTFQVDFPLEKLR